MSVRSTIDGTPLSSSVETSASPVPSWVIASKVEKAGFGRKGLGRRLHRLGFARRVGAERMLDAVAELGKHGFGHVERVLGDEIDADALGADQPDDLLDLLQQRLRRVVEQEVRLVEEEDQPRLLRIADLLGQFSNSSESSQSRNVA
jgi:hypothetical protein